jgi:hypothetical protein
MNESPYIIWRKETLEKFGNKCCQCNSQEKLEFDHIDPSLKSYPISQGWARKDIEQELSKCQLLCSKCHLEKTINSKKPFTHGSSYCWMKLKCKCTICLEARETWYFKRNAKRRISKDPKFPYSRTSEHGTYLSYKRGCKCDLCRKANSDKVQEYKKQA